jgi:hypothetical protein
MENVEKSDGVSIWKTKSWVDFVEFMAQHDNLAGYVWRGQGRSEWKLLSSLDRALAAHPEPKRRNLRMNHLSSFQFAIRGRRGQNPSHLDENYLWALGQHHGLKTPLLDWTSSPFVAAYFAFVDSAVLGTDSSPAVFGLWRKKLEETPRELRGRPDLFLRFFSPMSDENPRLVSQNGMFTRAPDGVDVESLVRERFLGGNDAALIKIEIEGHQRNVALRSLNRMNINHLTLFPDLFGSSMHCNLALEVDPY